MKDSLSVLKQTSFLRIIEINDNSFHDKLINIFANFQNDGFLQTNLPILMLDADVIPILKNLNKFCDLKMKYALKHGLVYNHIFKEFRFAGAHLYSRKLFENIRNRILKSDFNFQEFYQSNRPETYLKLLGMNNTDFVYYSRNWIGHEDSKLTSIDIFRKGLLLNIKFPEKCLSYSKYWEKLAIENKAFSILIAGVKASKEIQINHETLNLRIMIDMYYSFNLSKNNLYEIHSLVTRKPNFFEKLKRPISRVTDSQFN